MENQHLLSQDNPCPEKSTSDRKFVIFDLDGTLIDSFECALHCINHILLEYGCAQLNRRKISSGLAIHELLSLVKKSVTDKGIKYSEFKQKFDSLQYQIYSKPERHKKHYPTLMNQGRGMLLKSVSLGYKIVIITNKEQRAAIEILKRLYSTIDLIVIGRIKEVVLKSDSRKVLRRLKAHGLEIQNCIGYFGDSSEDIILAREIGVKSFNLIHRCENQKFNSLQNTDHEIGLSYISALIKVFGELSNTHITNPKFIFRGITQRYFTSSKAITELKNSPTDCKTFYCKLENELRNIRIDKPSSIQTAKDSDLYDIINKHVKDLIINDVIHTNGNSDLYAKYILQLMRDEDFYYKYLSPDYIRSGAAVRLNLPNTNHRQIDYLWYIRSLINEANRTYPQSYDKELNLLADLQHRGAATCLVDFSRNFLVSLWFATQDFDKEDAHETGYLFCYDINKESILDDSIEYINSDANINVSIEQLLKQTKKSVKYNGDDTYKFLVWTPSNINNRIVRQDSVFVFGIEPFEIEKHPVISIPIPFCWKRYIQFALKSFFGISAVSLYADEAGYASSNKKDTSVAINSEYFNKDFFSNLTNYAPIENFDLFQKATGCLMHGEYRHAMDYFYAFESINRTVFGQFQSSALVDSSGNPISLRLRVLCMELRYSMGLCCKHIDGLNNSSLCYFKDALTIAIDILQLHSSGSQVIDDCYDYKQKRELPITEILEYTKRKLYKVLDSYVGILLDVQYHILAYKTIEDINHVLSSIRISKVRDILLNTAQNEITLLARLWNNTDALSECIFKEISFEESHYFETKRFKPFCSVLNLFFKLCLELSYENEEQEYSKYVKTLESEIQNEYNLFMDEIKNDNNPKLLNNVFTAWDMADVKTGITHFCSEKPKKRKEMLNMLSKVEEIQEILEGHKLVEKY